MRWPGGGRRAGVPASGFGPRGFALWCPPGRWALWVGDIASMPFDISEKSLGCGFGGCGVKHGQPMCPMPLKFGMCLIVGVSQAWLKHGGSRAFVLRCPARLAATRCKHILRNFARICTKSFWLGFTVRRLPMGISMCVGAPCGRAFGTCRAHSLRSGLPIEMFFPSLCFDRPCIALVASGAPPPPTYLTSLLQRRQRQGR